MANAAESIIVPFSDDEAVREDELIVEDHKPAAGETPEQRESRLEKRRERAGKRERERKQQEEELATVKAELAQQRERTARLEGYVTAPRPAQGEQADP